ncbi:hypothetical protein DID88_005602 [Monilinia fructigena]|uniref:Imidazole glycerol-phosphate synthase n=1 Tax=Monilinia fructigena TaxID=38457 RepID=A0A395J0L9_9HELO|nr:hypothetical protein DID88_005602 [Monilinia fructigena]
MLEILRQTSKTVFVPLTIGGGIRDTVDTDGTKVSALEIAKMYFKSGADKVSIGSDAVTAAEEYYSRGKKLSGATAIEQISGAYGNQAVVVSVDPKRDQMVRSIAGMRALSRGAEKHEIWMWLNLWLQLRQWEQARFLLNCIDKDGTNSGFDLELIEQVKNAISIPVIASSGAGNPEHFEEVFSKTSTDAALGAGMFHRGEYTVKQVKGLSRRKRLDGSTI